MKNKVLLFFPNTDENLRLITPPLSLMALSGPLKKAGLEVIIIDSRLESDYEEKIKDLNDEIICMGVSSLTGSQITDGLNASKILRLINPKIPIVWGGWHPSILPEQTVSNQYIDIVVKGQGERTFLELVKKLQKNESYEHLSGITFKKEGKIINNPSDPLITLDELTPLDYDIVDLKKYPGRTSFDKSIFITFRTSQGCPFRCAFCADPLVFKRKFVILSAERVGEELEYLKNTYGINEVLFVDDTLFLSRKRIRSICQEFLKRKLNIKWTATVRTGMIAKMDLETLALVKESGCDLLHPGVEGSSQEILDSMNKDEKYENTFICAEKLAKLNIRALYSFIVGLPGEPENAVSETFKVIKRLKEIDPNNIMPINFYTPYPGNILYDKAKKYGFKEPTSLEGWGDFNTRKGNMPWLTNKINDDVMKRDKYYLPAAFPSDTMKNKMKKGNMKYLYRLFHLIAKFRVDHDWYFFDIDWKLLLAYWKFWQKYNKKLPLHDIHFRW